MIKISLDSYEKVNHFLHITEHIPGQLRLIQGDQEVNARSIMSLFTLDLHKPVYLELSEVKCVKKLSLFT